jgi:ADP-ribose pyrophosphatase YjhB (NUDIX family)
MLPRDLFRFCPRCGAAAESGRTPFRCPACDLTYFFNPTVAAGAFLFNPVGEVLLTKRAKEPAKGKLGIPGGFLDVGESAEDGLRREIREEVNLEVTNLRLLCSAPNLYEYKGVSYPVCDLIFTAVAVNPDRAEALDEIAGLEWRLPKAVNPEEIAFPSMRQGLLLLQHS